MRMLRAMLICALALCSAIAVAHSPDSPGAASPAELEILAVREAIRAAVKAKDAAALRRIYTDDFTHTHGSGKVDGKDARIVSALAGDPVIETAPVTDLVIRVPGGWTAIATGLSPIRSVADGKTYNFRWTVTYVRIGEGWQIAASQATRLAEAK